MRHLQATQRRLTTIDATLKFGEVSWHCLLPPDDRLRRRSRQAFHARLMGERTSEQLALRPPPADSRRADLNRFIERFVGR